MKPHSQLFAIVGLVCNTVVCLQKNRNWQMNR